MSDEPNPKPEPPAPKPNFARARNVAKASSEGKRIPKQDPAKIAAFQRLLSPAGVTPDQGCFAIIFGSTLLIGSLAFWLFYYYNHAPEFQQAGRQGPPAAQLQREREESRKNRINP